MAREDAKSKATTKAETTAGAKVATTSTTALKVGIDLGTNTTVVQVSEDGKRLPLAKDMVLSVVGFPKAGMIPGILPSNAEVLFGEEARNLRLHLDLKWPLENGFVKEFEVARLLAGHLRTLICADGERKLWGVVGAPANATPARQKELRSAMVGLLDRIVIVPEPFLAAMGLREDEGFMKSGASVDPTKHSLIVDIGAGTTDLCLVRGYFPTADDQISISKAGNHVDQVLHRTIQQRYPDLNLTPVTITQIKEDHAFVGDAAREALVKVYADGRPCRLDFGELIRDACASLIPDIVQGIKALLKQCDSDSTEQVLQNIILTGGGCQIVGICERVQEALRADGFDEAVTRKPSDYKRLVARGALRIAENVREDQWQVPF